MKRHKELQEGTVKGTISHDSNKCSRDGQVLTQRPVRADGVATDGNSQFLRAPETGCRQCLLDCFTYFMEQQRNKKNTKGHFK